VNRRFTTVPGDLVWHDEQATKSFTEAWEHERRNLRGEWTAAIDNALKAVPEAKLLSSDPSHGHLVAAIGNPATASHVLTYVPGVGEGGGLPGEMKRAKALRDKMDAEGKGSSAVLLWHDYRPPPSIHAALSKEDAIHSSARLAAFQHDLKSRNPRASHTVLGHSYGSLVAGEAARRHGMDPDDLIAIGSPGMGVRSASGLGIPVSHVWAGAESEDPVARAAYLLAPDFGGSPVKPAFGAHVFGAQDPGVAFPGRIHGGAHSSYWDAGSQALANVASIATGNYVAVKNWHDAWLHEARGGHGHWIHGIGSEELEQARGYQGHYEGVDTYIPDMKPAPGVKDLMSAGRPDGKGTPDDPIDVQGDLDKAVHLLQAGKSVRLNQPEEVAVLAQKVNQIATSWDKGKGPMPNINFGDVTVKGTNLFTAQTRGIPRAKMPQLAGPAQPGTKAADLVGAGNWADLAPELRKELAGKGVSITDDVVKPTHLRATQMDLNGASVAGIATKYLAGDAKVRTMMTEPLFVTRDNYVLDGHHRWAANMVVDAADGVIGDSKPINVHRINMDIGAMVPYANDFAQRWGIAAVSANVSQRTVVKNLAEYWKCLSCGCGRPHDDHGDHRHITLEDVEAAGDAAKLPAGQAAANIGDHFRTAPDADDKPAAKGMPESVEQLTPDVIAKANAIVGEINKRGNAQTLRDYWTGHGHGGPTHHAFEHAIAWGTGGDFMRCVAQLTAHGKMTPEQAKGYCNLRHHEALGYWPAQHARMDRGKGLGSWLREQRNDRGEWEDGGEEPEPPHQSLYSRLVNPDNLAVPPKPQGRRHAPIYPRDVAEAPIAALNPLPFRSNSHFFRNLVDPNETVDLNVRHRVAKGLGAWLSEGRDAHGEWTRGEGGAMTRRDPGPSDYVQLFHGTTADNARDIAQTGIREPSFSESDPTLTPDQHGAQVWAYERHGELEWPKKPGAVVEVRVPRDKESEYLYPAGYMDTRALRKPIPPEMIHSYKPVPGLTHEDRVALGER
jgi:hypothetical protein